MGDKKQRLQLTWAQIKELVDGQISNDTPINRIDLTNAAIWVLGGVHGEKREDGTFDLYPGGPI